VLSCTVSDQDDQGPRQHTGRLGAEHPLAISGFSQQFLCALESGFLVLHQSSNCMQEYEQVEGLGSGLGGYLFDEIPPPCGNALAAHVESLVTPANQSRESGSNAAASGRLCGAAVAAGAVAAALAMW
jgi:hypothetical protein